MAFFDSKFHVEVLSHWYLFCFFSSAVNDTIDHLDLSWNHLRNKGACAVALSLKVC